MWYRLPRKDYEAGKGAKNQERLSRLVHEGKPTGLIAYEGEQPVAWCSVAPRAQYLRLRRSRAMQAADDRPLWTIMCLFVAPSHRRQGLTVRLLNEAARWALSQGAPGVEAFPVVPKRPDMPPVFASQGLLTAYLEAGFKEVERRSDGRAVVRWPD